MLSETSKSFLDTLVATTRQNSSSPIKIVRVIDVGDYQVKCLLDGQPTPWLWQFCPDSANIDDLVIAMISSEGGCYFGIMQPTQIESDDPYSETYTIPRIASDIWDLDNPIEPWQNYDNI